MIEHYSIFLLKKSFFILMEPDKLMIVAHPDDESLWGGYNLLSEKGWKVIVATNKHHKIRSIEFYKTMTDAGVYQAEMFDSVDSEEEDLDTFEDSLFEEALIRDNKAKKWKLVLTHNKEGEYGHYQHQLVHIYVKKIFQGQNVKFFSIDKQKLSNSALQQKKELLRHYQKTQHIALLVGNSQDEILNEKERNHYQYEKLYVSDQGPKIPKIIHQIWVGGKMPKFKKIFIKSIHKVIMSSNGWSYRMWNNKDINKKLLPNTFQYIQRAKKIGKEIHVNKWAQISDLMRYEILYRYGGIYMDTNMEALKDLTPEINKANSEGVHFLGCNEEPCDLQCAGGPSGNKFLSNGFFACIAGDAVLKRAISEEYLSKINFKDFWVNRQTGPFYLRKAIVDAKKDKVKLLNSYLIYPFVANEGIIREKERNQCILENKTPKEKTKAIKLVGQTRKLYLINPCNKYPKAILMNHMLGGTWDFSDAMEENEE